MQKELQRYFYVFYNSSQDRFVGYVYFFKIEIKKVTQVIWQITEKWYVSEPLKEKFSLPFNSTDWVVENMKAYLNIKNRIVTIMETTSSQARMVRFLENCPRPNIACLSAPCLLTHSQELIAMGDRRFIPLRWIGTGSVVSSVLQSSPWDQTKARFLLRSHMYIAPFSASCCSSHCPLESPPPGNHIYRSCLKLCF